MLLPATRTTTFRFLSAEETQRVSTLARHIVLVLLEA